MDTSENRQAIGARVVPEGIVLVALRADSGVRFGTRVSFTQSPARSQPRDRIEALSRFVSNSIQEIRPAIFVVTTISPGARLRGTSGVRLQFEGVALLSAVQAETPLVQSVTTLTLRKHLTMARRTTAEAMDLVCKQLGLKSGAKRQIRRTPFDLDAIAAAFFGLNAIGEVLPDWVGVTGSSA